MSIKPISTAFFCLTAMLNFGMAKDAPKDSTAFQGKLYKVFKAELTWHEAAKKCRDMGGILASAKSAEANAFLVKLAEGKCVWLGATDEVKEGEWLWQDGTKVTYSNWAKHEPDNWYGGKEHYLVLSWPTYTKGEWGDARSIYKSKIYGYICEWEPKDK